MIIYTKLCYWQWFQRHFSNKDKSKNYLFPRIALSVHHEPTWNDLIGILVWLLCLNYLRLV